MLNVLSVMRTDLANNPILAVAGKCRWERGTSRRVDEQFCDP
jgi:hypothetical protein